MKNQVLNILIPKEPTGLKVIELANWSGKCFVVPRTDLKDMKERPESHDPALYFLFGEADESTDQKLYIGESEDFFYRLATHNDLKDFWNTALVFTGSLDKAKIKYLEYLSTKEAAETARYHLMNNTSPAENRLSEFDLVSVREYFDKIKYILTALGYPVFAGVIDSIIDQKTYFIKADGVIARAQLLEDGSLNVLQGSTARIRETESFWGWSQNARKRLLEDGTIKENGDGISYIFTKDMLFKSPSAAAATLTGRPINGWTAWKDENSNTLSDNLRK